MKKQTEKNRHGLSDQMLRFIDEYFVDLNGTRAYMAAYPASTERSARASAARLLATASVKAEMEDRRAAEREKYSDIRARILAQDWDILSADITDYAQTERISIHDESGNELQRDIVSITPTDHLTPRQRRCIKSIKQTRDGISIELEDKTAAKERILRMLAAVEEKTAATGGIDTAAVSALSDSDLAAFVAAAEKTGAASGAEEPEPSDPSPQKSSPSASLHQKSAPSASLPQKSETESGKRKGGRK